MPLGRDGTGSSVRSSVFSSFAPEAATAGVVVAAVVGAVDGGVGRGVDRDAGEGNGTVVPLSGTIRFAEGGADSTVDVP